LARRGFAIREGALGGAARQALCHSLAPRQAALLPEVSGDVMPKPSRALFLSALPRLAPVVVALGLAACTGDVDQLAPQCPQVSLVPDAASFSIYRGPGRDLTDLVLQAKLVDVKGFCKGTRGKPTINAQASLQMLVQHGPAADSRDADIPYGVGVVKNGQVLDRQERVEHVVFPPNADTVQLNSDPVNFVIPTGGEEIGPEYHIYFWLKLTPEQLAANRQAR
jgi:hypothetical protein